MLTPAFTRKSDKFSIYLLSQSHRNVEGVGITIMGKTIAALDVLMTQSRTRQLSWMMVNRWTFLSGTCLR